MSTILRTQLKSPDELNPWMKYNMEMGFKVPHFRSEWAGNKIVVYKITAQCKPCIWNCISRDGCPYRGDYNK